ncbi:MAG: CvpA family protein [Halocynthiibacter sp.]
MEGFTLVDGIAAGVIIISAILAYARGLTREAMSILGWVGAAIIAFLFANKALPLVKEIPYLDKIIGDSCELATISAFALVLALGLVVMAIFTPIVASLVQGSAIGGIDQALGFIFGAVRGVLLIVVALMVYDWVVNDESVPMVDDSRTARIFARVQDNIQENIPEDAPGWIEERFGELVSECSKTN